ncbi:MAG TPA: hypothetical protein GX717_04570, partial [Clostridiaceae bacterium]|nr:hypothetical protein [Clostridiaceae bacterium]
MSPEHDFTVRNGSHSGARRSALRRVLIVSNNPLSTTENNGKTILSYFDDWADVDVMQIYFRPESPGAVCGTSATTGQGMTFFQLTDRQVLGHRSGRIFSLSEQDIQEQLTTVKIKHKPNEVNRLYRANIRNKASIKLLREVHWKCYNFVKHNQQLLAKVKEFDPDILFFCAGDALFSFDIVEILLDHISASLVLYITDDYILPYEGVSPLVSWRRSLIRKKMLAAADRAELVFTIGEKMQRTYKDLYGIESERLVN